MKPSAFVFFISAVLILYTAINSYIFIRAKQVLVGFGMVRIVLLAVLVLWMAAYPAGRIMERTLHNGCSRFLIVSGSVYLGVMIHAILLILLIDLVRLGNFVFHFFPSAFSELTIQTARITGLTVCAVIALAVFSGYWNASHPRVRKYELTIPKRAGADREMNLVAVSDLHLGTIHGRKYLSKIAGMINELRPDAVLLVGDTFDEDVTEAAEQNLAEVLRGFQSRFGSYAVLGNHEYYGNAEKAASYFRQAGVTVLEDQSVMLGDSVSLIGRKDRTAEQMGSGRKAIHDLLTGLDRSRPLILLDHQPFHLELAQTNGIDLQISGHTHHGQLFPFNWITNKVYELSWGYLKKGKTHVIVSCGAGTWGPPVRTGSVPEILQIRLKFEENRRELGDRR
jgi:predicted MPP superfamily phosphohydrolase